jgi:hypothetical protein
MELLQLLGNFMKHGGELGVSSVRFVFSLQDVCVWK